MRDPTDLRARVTSVPDAFVTRGPAVERAIEHSVEFLGSDRAQQSLAADTYWPKWDSPWWHMRLLDELGEARRIPERVVATMIDRLNALPIKTFPIAPEDAPPGADLYRDTSCHCAVGTIDQVLAACGVDVDLAVPWIRPWFVRYQMPDGGLNCDNAAYVHGDAGASSMVATVPLFEAMLSRGARTADEHRFVDRAASFLIERRLTQGSRSTFNAEERDAAVAWLQSCFPRFYLYDVLRGLAVLVRWAESSARVLPIAAISEVVEHLCSAFPDGIVRVQRRAYLPMSTLIERGGTWVREPASTFPLLDVTSVPGDPSEALTRQWSATRRALIGLIDNGRSS